MFPRLRLAWGWELERAECLRGVGVHGEDGLCVCSLVTLVVLCVCVVVLCVCVCFEKVVRARSTYRSTDSYYRRI